MRKAVGLIVLVACGGGRHPEDSGIDPARSIVSLDATEKESLCRYLAGLQERPSRVIDCEQFSIEVGVDDFEVAVEACIEDRPVSDCTYTVSEAETCVEVMTALSDSELCAIAGSGAPLPPACANRLPGCWIGL
jgi:hypothetical protein